MPIIKLEIGKVSKEQKQDLISEFTEVAARITKIPKSAFTVLIDQYSDENIGIGGETLEDIKGKNG